MSKRKKGRKIFFIRLAVFSLLFSLLKGGYGLADSAQVVINEIAWMGTTVSSNNEWLELKNLSSGPIVLEGWTLRAQDGTPALNLTGQIAAGGYFLLERTDDDTLSEIAADQIYTGALSNSGEILELRNSAGELIDSLNGAAGWPAGDNTNKLTLERTSAGGWQSSALANGTPRAANSEGSEPPPVCGNGQLESGEECDDNNTAAGDGCDKLCKKEGEEQTTAASSPEQEAENSGQTSLKNYNLGEAVINEFVADPADGETEWLELYNSSGKEINLDGWTIEEGSKARTNLSGQLARAGFMVIEKPKGNLNNDGDIIILRDGQSNLIDQVAYGNWDDGQKDNNAPAASDPFSIARKFDGQNTFNNFYDFAVTAKLTKGESNVIEKSEEEKNKQGYDYSDNIFISEIFPDPAGEDNTASSSGEFIELYNFSERDVDLAGWVLGDESQRRSEFKNQNIIKAKGFLVIYRSESGLALNNDSDEASLFQPFKTKPSRTVKYEKAKEGFSYSLDFESLGKGEKYFWTITPTPGALNKIEIPNHPPAAVFYFKEAGAGQPIIFDASDSSDEDGDELKFSWDFGDGFSNTLRRVEHTFFKSGAYPVKLTVDDGLTKTSQEKIARIGLSALNADQAAGTSSLASARKGEIIINEFLPAPKSGEKEWIEFYNTGRNEINLYGWKIDDSAAGNPYLFPEERYLAGGEFLLLDQEETGLFLNNSGDAIYLFDGLGGSADKVSYGKAAAGEAYARGENGKWFWTTVATPGEKNIISVAESEETATAVKAVKSGEKNTAVALVSLEDMKNFSAGDLIKTAGTVAVLPGILGSQYFYIVGSPGLQIYSYKKDFPSLKVGDYLEVSGELSEINGELRLKTKTAADIKVIEHRTEPQAEKTECEKIDEESIGRLLAVSGEIVEKKGSTIYLDDGSDEFLVYIKNTTGIDLSSFNEGDLISASGIVTASRSGLRIMPRFRDDLIKTSAPGQALAGPQVLGEVAENDNWSLAARDKKMELFQYLLILSGGLILILAVFLFRELRRKRKEKTKIDL